MRSIRGTESRFVDLEGAAKRLQYHEQIVLELGGGIIELLEEELEDFGDFLGGGDRMVFQRVRTGVGGEVGVD